MEGARLVGHLWHLSLFSSQNQNLAASHWDSILFSDTVIFTIGRIRLTFVISLDNQFSLFPFEHSLLGIQFHPAKLRLLEFLVAFLQVSFSCRIQQNIYRLLHSLWRVVLFLFQVLLMEDVVCDRRFSIKLLFAVYLE